jgi:putative ABC transport system substrate-binding protein
MRRRELLAALALGPATAPAWAQGLRPHKIGYLHPRTTALDSPTVAVLRPAWERLGYVTGESVITRSAEGDLRRLPDLAAELIKEGSGVLIAVGPAALAAASRTGAPVVAIDQETDPVRAGLAVSYSRPGGNVTGLFVDQPTLAGKMVDLLKDAAPGIEQIAIVRSYATTPEQLDAAHRAARARGLEPIEIQADEPGGFDGAFLRIGGTGSVGAIALPTPGFIVDAHDFAAAAVRYQVPTLAFLRAYMRDGILLTYGPNQSEYFPRAVVLAQRILRGEKPGDLPIEQPTQYELVLNIRTARLLGLSFPPALLAQADEVVE